VAAELALFALQKSLGQHRHPKIAVLSDGLGIPSMLKLLWLKSTFAAKTARFILK
jgi:hypothetical protein